MEYPDTKLTRPVRTGILIAFIALFFIIAPLIIMYTQGYRYDWKNGQRREIGAVSIDVEPTDAVANLGGVDIKTGMPIRLKNITPRKYHLRLSSPEYFDWDKDIEVLNKQTVYIKEIGLIKKNNPELIASLPATEISLSSDGSLLAFVSGQSVKLLNIQNGQLTDIFFSKKNESLKISWGPDSHWLLIAGPTAPFTRAIAINADESDKKIDLTTIDNDINKLQWNQSGGTQLVYSTTAKIKSLDLGTGNITLIGKNIYLDWYMENSSLWTVQISTNTKKIKIIQDTLGFASELSIVNSEILPDDHKQLTLAMGKNNHALLRSIGQPLMFLVSPVGTYKIAAENFTVSPYNNWWLFWTPWELTAFSENAQPILLNRSGEGLKQVLPLDNHNTLALIWNAKTTALFPYYSVTHDLINYAVDSAATDSVNHILYFGGKIDDKQGLWKLEY